MYVMMQERERHNKVKLEKQALAGYDVIAYIFSIDDFNETRFSEYSDPNFPRKIV